MRETPSRIVAASDRALTSPGHRHRKVCALFFHTMISAWSISKPLSNKRKSFLHHLSHPSCSSAELYIIESKRHWTLLNGSGAASFGAPSVFAVIYGAHHTPYFFRPHGAPESSLAEPLLQDLGVKRIRLNWSLLRFPD